jgi:hypothetical protein
MAELERDGSLTICWCCDRLIHIRGDGPGPGDLTVCGWCGALAMLEGDLRTAAPSDEVLALVAADPVWRGNYIALLRQAGAMREARERGV